LDKLGSFWSRAHAYQQVGEIESTVQWLYLHTGDVKAAARQAGCLDSAFPWLAYCATCDAGEWWLRFSCGHRACAGCHRRYHAEKAREIREALGPIDWLGYLTLTIHPYHRPKHQPEDFTRRSRELARALERWFAPLIPAGAIYIHHSGESDPWKHHPHYNVILGSHGWNPDTGKVEKIGPKWLEVWHLKAWRDRLSWDAWKIPRIDVQGHWEYRDTETKMGHALRYAVRSQGDGNPRARHYWTKERLRMLRPFGMLATGKRSKWSDVFPWPSEQEKSERLGWDVVSAERCGKCGSGLRDLTPKT
jgi:hypothetical protein